MIQLNRLGKQPETPCRRLPFIITTNLPLAEMQAPKDLAHTRIYDRILERCTPICFNGPNYRKGNAAANKDEAARLLNE